MMYRAVANGLKQLIGGLVIAGMLAPLGSALAAETAPYQTARDSVTLISGSDQTEPGTDLMIALRIALRPGWNTYWKNPGDAGTAPEIDLSLPPGVTSSGILYPAPRAMLESGLMAYGYRGTVVLPIKLSHLPKAPLTIKAAASWLVCQNICVPEQHEFTLVLPTGIAMASAQQGEIAQALTQVPVQSPFAATIAADGTLRLTGTGLSPATVARAQFFPDQWGPINLIAPQPLSLHDGVLTLALKPGTQFNPGAPLSGVLELRDTHGNVSNLQIRAVPGGSARSAVLTLLIAAFLGGLILNLMPCVFPVLAMKAMALSHLGGAQRAHIRWEALSYTLGVVISFVALGSVLALARSLGGGAAWGFQFQQPLFVALMAALMLAVTLNLWGIFDFNLRFFTPHRGGHWGSFLTGLLAVLLATPCTAPFMAVAIAGALQAPPIVAMAIFALLGLGMALPYALLALAPGLARVLPRPGQWMVTLRRILALPMAGTLIWLFWVASRQLAPNGMLALTLLLASVAVGFASLGRYQRGNWKPLHPSLFAACLAMALITAGLNIEAWRKTGTVDSAQRFTPEKLAALRASGQPVFVDMSAAWCVTCLVNERIALDPAAVRQAFASRKITYLKGDWTNQDPAVTRFLHDFNRDGVPLYVFYPAQGAPVVLPQILTAQTVLQKTEAN